MASISRRLRFSLRTLFVALTVVCVVLGWQGRSIYERRSVLSWMHEHASCHPALMGKHLRRKVLAAFDCPEPPWFRKVLGDCRVPPGFWCFQEPLSASELERIKQAFPEVPFDYLEDKH